MGPTAEPSDPPDDPGHASGLVGDGPSKDDREFERYALVASLTLCVLSLLLLDGLRARRRVDALPQDRLVRLVLGGVPPLAAAQAPAPQPVPADLPPATPPQAPGSEEAGEITPRPPEPQPVEPATRPYVVGEQETLGEIARRELGSTTRIPEIVELNGLPDPDRIRAGQTLLLPAR